jgi:hypothetical protein
MRRIILGAVLSTLLLPCLALAASASCPACGPNWPPSPAEQAEIDQARVRASISEALADPGTFPTSTTLTALGLSAKTSPGIILPPTTKAYSLGKSERASSMWQPPLSSMTVWIPRVSRPVYNPSQKLNKNLSGYTTLPRPQIPPWPTVFFRFPPAREKGKACNAASRAILRGLLWKL